MAKDSIIVSSLLTQSDIRNKRVRTHLRMLAEMPGRLKGVEHFIVGIFLPFRKGMKEGF